MSTNTRKTRAFRPRRVVDADHDAIENMINKARRTRQHRRPLENDQDLYEYFSQEIGVRLAAAHAASAVHQYYLY